MVSWINCLNRWTTATSLDASSLAWWTWTTYGFSAPRIGYMPCPDSLASMPQQRNADNAGPYMRLQQHIACLTLMPTVGFMVAGAYMPRAGFSGFRNLACPFCVCARLLLLPACLPYPCCLATPQVDAWCLQGALGLGALPTPCSCAGDLGLMPLASPLEQPLHGHWTTWFN